MVRKHDPHVSHSNAILHHCATSVSCGPAGRTVSSCISPNKTWQESVATKGGWWRETLSTLPLLHPLLSAASRNLNATNSRYDRGRAEVQRLWGAWRGLAAGTWKLSGSILKATDKKKTPHTPFLTSHPSLSRENSWRVKLNSKCISQGADERAGIAQNMTWREAETAAVKWSTLVFFFFPDTLSQQHFLFAALK